MADMVTAHSPRTQLPSARSLTSEDGCGELQHKLSSDLSSFTLGFKWYCYFHSLWLFLYSKAHVSVTKQVFSMALCHILEA